MALTRTNTTLVTKEEVTATTGRIRQVVINNDLKKITCEIEWGNIVDDKFIPINLTTPINLIETFEMKDTDYEALSNALPDIAKNMYSNIRKMLWDKLIELGHVKGSVA